ncbi:gamma-secretase subunit APH, partial [Acrasis kona]
YLALIGNALIVFGPIVSIFNFYLCNIPQLVIVFVAAAFFYLLSTCLTSAFYFIPGIVNLPYLLVSIGVSIQEIFRFALFLAYLFTERGYERNLKVKLLYGKFAWLHASVAAGLGFATCHALLLNGNVLSQSYGPGTLYLPNCPTITYFTHHSIMTLLFVLLNISWMIIGFQGYIKKSVLRIISLLVLHFAASLITVLNNKKDSCLYVLPTLASLVVIGAIISTVELIIICNKDE